LDHMDWLGPDRDSIGREKAGIARAGRQVIVGELDPPAGLLDTLTAIGANVQRAGVDFSMAPLDDGWRWQHRDGLAMALPAPALAAPVQVANAAAAIAALHALFADDRAMPSKDFFAAVRQGLQSARVLARLQSLGGDPALLVDVGHNPQAARALAQWLDAQPPARTQAVYGALSDKDVAGVLGALGSRVDRWHLAGLAADTPRGLSATALVERLRHVLPEASFDTYIDVAGALAGARAQAHPGERILAFGSFFVASAVLAASLDKPASAD
jgi:dihydrofolate synthase/folylpolyglutamate synthase